MRNFLNFRSFALWVLLPLVIILGPVAGNYARDAYVPSMIEGGACGGQPCPPLFSRWEDVFVSASPSLELVEAAEGPAGERQWTLTVDLVTSSPVPLSYRDARLQTGAGEATGELAGRLSGSLLVRYDGTAVPLRQFSVVGDQVLTARAWTRPAKTSGTTATSLPVPAFPLVDGQHGERTRRARECGKVPRSHAGHPLTTSGPGSQAGSGREWCD